jgi:phosphoribosyl 1,2-cyclic phosphodiesterase
MKEENEFLIERIKKTHMSLDGVKKFLAINDLSKIREIRLIHLSDSNSDPDYFKREIQKLTGKLTIIA